MSSGTDDDAHGVLAGFGLTGDIERGARRRRLGRGARDAAQGGPGARPESRVHTALEASLNCEVHIRT